MAVLDKARPPYPMKPISALNGYENGRLDDRVLAEVTRGLKANVVSARKFKVLQSEAVKAGIPLSSTGINRTFQQQLDLQDQRYDKGYFPGRRDYNTFQGVVWSLKPGQAMAATPGTSNHGFGRSNDLCVMINGKLVSLRASDLVWLAEMAPKCGLFFEVVSESWHCTDYSGDDIPQFVLDKELEQLLVFIPEFGIWSLYPLDPKKAVLRYYEDEDKRLDSDLVRYAQGVMKLRMNYPLLLDGVYGPVMQSYVRKLQKRHKLKPTGNINRATWKVIDKAALTK